jgi:hypothetical protein
MKPTKFVISSVLSGLFAISPPIFKSEASSFDFKENSKISNSVEISIKDVFVPFRPPNIHQGCGTGCSIRVYFLSDVTELSMSDGRSIRMARVRISTPGALKEDDADRYIFAECSANKLAFNDSSTLPSENWIFLPPRSEGHYTAGYLIYFDSLCFGRTR